MSDLAPQPSSPPPPPEEPLSRRARQLLREVDRSGFLRRVAQVMDFWREAPPADEEAGLRNLRELCRTALDQKGKLAGLMAVARLADAYGTLSADGRAAFFQMLVLDFGPPQGRIAEAVEEWLGAAADKPNATLRLTKALESPRTALFQQFNTIPQGIKFLVDLRADVWAARRTRPELEVLEYELRGLLEAFFNLGLLELKRITWDSPAALLENLVAYEAVHEITHWRDLKHRLLSDRACFAFLHPAIPTEPVIFVEVALVKGLADNIQRLLDIRGPDLHPAQADTAIFYGISNAQKGLRGIPFGNLLIKQVATRLRTEVPNLETFATLSPLPRFRADFLDAALESGSLTDYYKEGERKRLLRLADATDAGEALRRLLAEPHWFRDEETAEALRPGLLRAARHYLTEERVNGRAACPVAHFHASNGARLVRINWLGDTSRNGLRQSAGIMVNYDYDLDAFNKVQEEYFATGRVAVSRAVKDL